MNSRRGRPRLMGGRRLDTLVSGWDRAEAAQELPRGRHVSALAQHWWRRSLSSRIASALCWNRSAVTCRWSEIAARGASSMSPKRHMPTQGRRCRRRQSPQGAGVRLVASRIVRGRSVIGEPSVLSAHRRYGGGEPRNRQFCRIPLPMQRIQLGSLVKPSCRWPGAGGGVRSQHDRTPADDPPCPARRGGRVGARRPPAATASVLLAELDGAPLAIVAVDGGSSPADAVAPGRARGSSPAHVPAPGHQRRHAGRDGARTV